MGDSEYLKKWKAANPDRVKQYARRRDLKNAGYTPEYYDALYAAQGGKCGICRGSTDERLLADHDHVTGRPRQLLCRKCNSGLGMFKDDPDLMRQAAAYVEYFATRGEQREKRN